MKFIKSMKLMATVCMAFSLSFASIHGASADHANTTRQIQKIPDAFNATLEKSKLQKYGSKVPLTPGKPFVLEFDDGSSIIYTAEVVPNKSVLAKQTTINNTVNLRLGKTYTYLKIAYAKLTLNVDNVTYSGRKIEPSGKLEDVYLTKETFLTEVSSTVNRAKAVTIGGDTRLRAQSRGDLKFDIQGIKQEQSYDFVYEVDPLLGIGQPYIVDSY